MNIMLVLTYFSHGLENLVNHNWTGGWLDGYVMVFINAVLLGVIMLVEHRCFVNMSWSLAHKFVPNEKWKKFKPARLFWIFPLFIVSFLTILYIPLVSIGLILFVVYYIIRQVILFHPRYDIALIVFFFSIFSSICCAVLFYTFIWSLLLGILAICLIAAIPETVGKTVSQAVSQTESETSFEDECDNKSKEGRVSWDGQFIEKNDGSLTRITHVNSDGSLGTADGRRHNVGVCGDTKEC